MSCHECGETHEGRSVRCPACGAALAGDGCSERRVGGAADGHLVADGGQPTDDESDGGTSGEGGSADDDTSSTDSADDDPADGRSTDGRSAGGQVANAGRTADEMGAGGQAPAGAQAAGTAGGAGTGGGGAGSGHGTGGAEFDAVDLVDELPLKGGATIGFFATILPYLLITLAGYVPIQRDEFGITAELYATIVGFGPGERFVDLFVAGTDVSALGNVRPEEYPSVDSELAAVLETLIEQPEALLLPLYVLAPLVCYLGGRSLAKRHGGDSVLTHARVALPLPLGALPVTLVVGLAFGVEALAGAVFVGGLFVPLAFGALGGLTVYAFRDLSWTVSKGYGWLAGLVGLNVAVVLVPIPAPSFGGLIEIGLAQHYLFGTMAFLGTVNFAVGGGAQGIAMFLLVLLLTVLAGFVRTHRSDRPTPTVLNGVRVGASVALGFVAMVALLAIALPFVQIVISLPFGANAWFAAVLPSVAKYTGIVVLAAIYACLFAGAGGALAVWNRDRENVQLR